MTVNDYGLYSRSTNKRPSIHPDKCDFEVFRHLVILDEKPTKGLWAHAYSVTEMLSYWY